MSSTMHSTPTIQIGTHRCGQRAPASTCHVHWSIVAHAAGLLWLSRGDHGQQRQRTIQFTGSLFRQHASITSPLAAFREQPVYHSAGLRRISFRPEHFKLQRQSIDRHTESPCVRLEHRCQEGVRKVEACKATTAQSAQARHHTAANHSPYQKSR